MANNISVGQALRKDVWSALWASDNPQMLAVAEKARLYVMRDTEPEEPLTMQGYLCTFKVSIYKISYLLDHAYISKEGRQSARNIKLYLRFVATFRNYIL